MKIAMDVDAAGFLNTCSVTLSRVARGTRIATQEGANAILAAAQARCPRYTGTLMRSGRVEMEGSSANNYSPGFSATISFGGGNEVNPITGEHPSAYAAAVHEGFAVNPITGEYSKYKSGEEGFLIKAVKDFEQTGLQRLAYKHWGNALRYFNEVQVAGAEAYARDMRGEAALGTAWTERTTIRNGDILTRKVFTDEVSKADFFSESTIAKRNREKTRIFMGVTKDTPGVTNENLYQIYLKNKRLITQASLYAQGIGVDKAAQEVIDLANAFMFEGVFSIKGASRYSLKKGGSSSSNYLARLKQLDKEWQEARKGTHKDTF